MTDPERADEPLFEDESGSLDPEDALLDRMRRRRRIALVLFPLVLLAAGTVAGLSMRSTPAERAQHLHDLGEMFAHDQKWNEAETRFRESLELLPGRPDTLALLGEVLMRLEREDEAVAMLRSAIETKPFHTRANRVLARWHFERGDLREAEDHALAAVAEPPAPIAAYEILSNVRLRSGDALGALEAFEAVLEIRPDAGPIHLYAGYAADFLARTTWDPALAERAREHFRAAADASRGDPEERETFGAALVGLGLYAGAALALRAVESQNAVVLQVEALAAQGRFEEAETVVAEALRAGPSPPLTAALARLHLRRGRLGDAALLLEVPADGEDDPHIWYARLAYLQAQAAATAPDELLHAGIRGPGAPFNVVEPALAATLRDAPPNAAARRARLALVGPGVLHDLLVGETDEEARTAFDLDIAALRKANVRDPVPYVWQGAVALRVAQQLEAGSEARAKRIEDAHRHLLDALKYAPEMPQALHVSGLVWGEMDRWDMAQSDAEKACAGVNRSPERLAAAVRAVHRRGDPGTAADAGRRALLEWPGNLALTHVLHAALLDLDDPAAQREVDLLQARLALGRGDVGAAGGAAALLLREAPDDLRAAGIMEGAWARIAADYARQALADPRDVTVAVRHALSLERAGRIGAAVRALRDARERLDDPIVHLELAAVYFRQNDDEAATEVLRVVRERFPDDTRALLRLAVLERASGRDADADATFRDVFVRESAPTATRALAARGLLVRDEPDQRDVARVEVWLGDQDTAEPAIALLRAELLLARGQTEEAVTLAKDVARAHPTATEPLHLLALTHMRANQWKEAEDALIRVLGLQPGHRRMQGLLATTRLRLGMEALSAGRIEDARDYLERGLFGRDEDVMAALLLAEIAPADVHSLIPEATHARIERRHPRSPAGPLYMAHLNALRGRTKDALSHYEEAVVRAPLHPAPLAGLVDAALRLGQFQLALRACREAAAHDEETGFADYLLGHSLQRTGLVTAAEGAYRKALEKDPGNPAAAVALVRLLIEEDRAEEARDTLATTVTASAEPASRKRQLTRLLLRVGDSTVFSRRLRSALRVSPESLQPEGVLGRLMLELGDVDGAEAWFIASIEADPEGSAPYYQLLEAMSRAGRVDEGAAIVRAATVAHPENPAPYAALGILHHQRGELDEAEKLFRKALELRPDLPIAANSLAWIVGVDRGRPEEGVRLLEGARAVSPFNPTLLDTHGWLLHLAGRDTAAGKDLELAARLRPTSRLTMLHYARVLDSQGRKTLARAAYERVLRLDEEFAKANEVPARIAELSD